jgi:hypothetical protein
MCAWHHRGQLKPTPRTLAAHCGKTLQEYAHSSKASGATPAGALARPNGTAQQPGGKKVPSGSTNLCGFLTETTTKARGLMSGTTTRSPNNGGKPLFSKIIIVNYQTHKPQNTPTWSRLRAEKGPRPKKPLAAHQAAGLDTPRANLRLALGPGAAPRNPRFAREVLTVLTTKIRPSKP